MKKLLIHPCRVPLPTSATASTPTHPHRQSDTKCIHGECMASGGPASISSSTGYEPNIVGNNSDAGMIAKNDHQSTATERSRTSRPRFYPPNMERRWEIRRILFSMSNTHCLSKLLSGARRDAMLSIINEHASRMPLDNLSGLHATKDKLLWQGQYASYRCHAIKNLNFS